MELGDASSDLARWAWSVGCNEDNSPRDRNVTGGGVETLNHIADALGEAGFDVRVYEYPGTARYKPGPLAPHLDAADLEGIQVGVLHAHRDGTRDWALTTNIETWEGSPRDSFPERWSMSASLSVSGIAVILEAVAQNEAWSDVYVFTGDLGHRRWNAIAYYPWIDEVGPMTSRGHELILQVQDVGRCSSALRVPSSIYFHEPSRTLRDRLVEEVQVHGLRLDPEILPSIGRKPGEWGVTKGAGYQALADAWAAQDHGTSFAMLSNGWWGDPGVVGTTQDAPSRLCWQGMEEVQELLSDTPAWDRALGS